MTTGITKKFAAAALASCAILSGCGNKAEPSVQPAPVQNASRQATQYSDCQAAKENGKEVIYCKKPNGTVGIITPR